MGTASAELDGKRRKDERREARLGFAATRRAGVGEILAPDSATPGAAQVGVDDNAKLVEVLVRRAL